MIELLPKAFTNLLDDLIVLWVQILTARGYRDHPRACFARSSVDKSAARARGKRQKGQDLKKVHAIKFTFSVSFFSNQAKYSSTESGSCRPESSSRYRDQVRPPEQGAMRCGCGRLECSWTIFRDSLQDVTTHQHGQSCKTAGSDCQFSFGTAS